ncbi:MAG: hypothetical protein KC506_01160 [Nanoarchaeota archaeon]|nr:hypothetical protein [Nanoarchaeota archaeon]
MKRERYQLRRKDFILPIAGYVSYIDRNRDNLIEGNKGDDYWKATGCALGLAFYHFGFLPMAFCAAAVKLEELLG